jgi:hypothetical protein
LQLQCQDHNIQRGGGLAGIIGLVDASAPFEARLSRRAIDHPRLYDQPANANAIKAQIPVMARLTNNGLPLVGQMVSSSSRGPNPGVMFHGNDIMYGQLIKPEIGAPGASVSAEAGTGLGATAFGGTSGATPMVTGSAALLLNSSRFLGRLEIGPLELKSLLMNNAETNILTQPAALGGALAPITRIGGGEVRVDRAVASPSAAWEFNNRTGALSFGFMDVTKATTRLTRTVAVHNYRTGPSPTASRPPSASPTT